MRRLLLVTAILAVSGCASSMNGAGQGASSASYTYLSSMVVAPAATDHVVVSTASASTIPGNLEADDD